MFYTVFEGVFMQFREKIIKKGVKIRGEVSVPGKWGD